MRAALLSYRSHRDYWDSFYAGPAEHLVPEQPSPFARWAAPNLTPVRTIIEFGFGTARDSLWFATQGHVILGFDFAESAVDQAGRRARAAGADASFEVLDLYDRSQVDRVSKALRELEGAPVVYGRFLLHSLEDEGRWNLFDLMSEQDEPGCQFLFEFRTGQDADAEHLFGDDHFRQFLEPELVAGEIRQRGGSITHEVAGHGLAVHKSEDPHVARVAGHWGSEPIVISHDG